MLLSLADDMKKVNVKFLLVQVDEAHSTAWPIGLENTPDPQKTFIERVERANSFVNIDKPNEPFIICVDGWNNIFADRFRIWPDKYYLIDNKYNVLAKSEYGEKKDALINVDCVELVCSLIK